MKNKTATPNTPREGQASALKPVYNVIAYNRYNTVMKTFKSRDAARRHQELLNRNNDGMIYGVVGPTDTASSVAPVPAATPAEQLTLLFTQIAAEYLQIETLEPANSDRLDFHEVSVRGIRRALEAAFEAGKKQAATRATKSASKKGFQLHFDDLVDDTEIAQPRRHLGNFRFAE